MPVVDSIRFLIDYDINWNKVIDHKCIKWYYYDSLQSNFFLFPEFVQIFMSTQYPFAPAEQVAKDKKSQLESREQSLKRELDGT